MAKTRVYTTTVRLSHHNSKFLTAFAMRILHRTQRHANKSLLLRSIVQGVAEGLNLNHLDLDNCTSEAELTRAIANAIAAGATNGKTRAGGRA